MTKSLEKEIICEIEYTCSDCGAVINEEALKCPQCGELFDDDVLPEKEIEKNIFTRNIGIFETTLFLIVSFSSVSIMLFPKSVISWLVMVAVGISVFRIRKEDDVWLWVYLFFLANAFTKIMMDFLEK